MEKYVSKSNLQYNVDKTKQYVENKLEDKQDVLVSGENIKTINNTSLLGEGNIVIEGVTDYVALNNLPQINGNTLTGNQTSNELGLQETLTSAQLDAVNSGIDNIKVAQIGINQTNITNLQTSKQNTIDSSHKLSADLIDDGVTNKVFTATEQTKLASIESGAQVNTVDSVNSKTGVVVLDADDIDDTSTTNKFVTASEKTSWDNKSVVSVSDSGSVTDEVEYITINGTEKKIGGTKVTFVRWL